MLLINLELAKVMFFLIRANFTKQFIPLLAFQVDFFTLIMTISIKYENGGSCLRR
jgi:hypothetical protein